MFKQYCSNSGDGGKHELIMSFVFCILMLWCLGSCFPWREWPSQGWPVLKDNKYWPRRTFFRCKPTSPEPSPELPSLAGSHTLDHYPPALITPRAGTRQVGTAPVLHGLLKLFKLDSLKPVDLPCPFLPVETTVKVLARSAHLPLPPGWAWCFPGWPLLLGTVNNRLSFQL